MPNPAGFSIRTLLAASVVAALILAPFARPVAIGIGPPLFAEFLIVAYAVCQAVQRPRHRPFWLAYYYWPLSQLDSSGAMVDGFVEALRGEAVDPESLAIYREAIVDFATFTNMQVRVAA